MSITYPFEVECHIYRRPNLRDDNLEMEMYMGRSVLDGMFDQLVVMPLVTTLFLSFPERWLNIIEQRQFYERLKMYCPNLKKLTMKTHSVFIIQCTPAGSLSMVEDIPDHDQHDITKPQWTSNRRNLINMNKINVI